MGALGGDPACVAVGLDFTGCHAGADGSFGRVNFPLVGQAVAVVVGPIAYLRGTLKGDERTAGVGIGVRGGRVATALQARIRRLAVCVMSYVLAFAHGFVALVLGALEVIAAVSGNIPDAHVVFASALQETEALGTFRIERAGRAGDTACGGITHLPR
jgi:hypothetical protein